MVNPSTHQKEHFYIIKSQIIISEKIGTNFQILFNFNYLRRHANAPPFAPHLAPSGQGQVKQSPVQAKYNSNQETNLNINALKCST